MSRRRPFLTAKRLLTNQTFRDLYRTDTVAVDQRLKITSLTFLFTDLRGSTELYERVGDLNAFDMVRAHFQVLQEIVASEAGAVVKTIGDAVMATFPTPDRAVAAAIKMREAMRELNAKSGGEDLLLKIGVHEGPCIAVTMNDRQDYFGQTVNIASRVQGLATSQAIFVTSAVVDDKNSANILAARQAATGLAGSRPARHRTRRADIRHPRRTGDGRGKLGYRAAPGTGFGKAMRKQRAKASGARDGGSRGISCRNAPPDAFPRARS